MTRNFAISLTSVPGAFLVGDDRSDGGILLVGDEGWLLSLSSDDVSRAVFRAATRSDTGLPTSGVGGVVVSVAAAAAVPDLLALFIFDISSYSLTCRCVRFGTCCGAFTCSCGG